MTEIELRICLSFLSRHRSIIIQNWMSFSHYHSWRPLLHQIFKKCLIFYFRIISRWVLKTWSYGIDVDIQFFLLINFLCFLNYLVWSFVWSENYFLTFCIVFVQNELNIFWHLKAFFALLLIFLWFSTFKHIFILIKNRLFLHFSLIISYNCSKFYSFWPWRQMWSWSRFTLFRAQIFWLLIFHHFWSKIEVLPTSGWWIWLLA